MNTQPLQPYFAILIYLNLQFIRFATLASFFTVSTKSHLILFLFIASLYSIQILFNPTLISTWQAECQPLISIRPKFAKTVFSRVRSGRGRGFPGSGGKCVGRFIPRRRRSRLISRIYPSRPWCEQKLLQSSPASSRLYPPAFGLFWKRAKIEWKAIMVILVSMPDSKFNTWGPISLGKPYRFQTWKACILANVR